MAEEYNQLYVNLMRNTILTASIKAQHNIVQKIIHAMNSERIDELAQEDEEEQKQFLKMLLSWLKESVSTKEIEFVWYGIMVCQNVQAFDLYITQILQKIFMQNREKRDWSEFSVKFGDLLKYNTDEILMRLAEKKIDDLSREGLYDIVKYFIKNLKMEYNIKDYSFIQACEIYQVRHLVVHNNSVVDKKYLQNGGKKDLAVGDIYPLTEKYVEQGNHILVKVGLELDKQFTKILHG